MTTIEIWSDWACPFCWIGQTHLLTALDLLELGSPEDRKAKNITITHKSFQLDPSSPVTEAESKGVSYYRHLEVTKGWSEAQRTQIFNNMTQKGKALGLEFNFDAVKLANTRRGHVILKLLENKYPDNDQVDMLGVADNLFSAYFKNGIDFKNTTEMLKYLKLDDKDKIPHLTVEEVDNASLTLPDDNKAAVKFKEDIALARKMGISGVPLFVFNGGAAGSVSGAQPPEALAMAIKKALKK